MVIIVNGAPKTGSTWLRHVIANMIDYVPIPDPYQNKAWGEIGALRSIAPKALKRFLNEEDYDLINYISKNHFHGQYELDLLLTFGNSKIFCIERDLKDVVVSYYYHQLRKGTLDCEFESYYWKYGRFFIQFMLEYQRVWHVSHPQIYISSYDALKNNFSEECYRIAGFLGVSLTEGKIKSIKNATSMESMRKKWGEDAKKDEKKKFFRKGIIGDWENHFNETMIQDFLLISQNGLSGIDFIKYQILYPVRLRILKEYESLRYR